MTRWDQQHRVFFQYLIDEENLEANQINKGSYNSDKLK